MAETALGMATTLVGSALGVASSAAREMGLLLWVQDDIWYYSFHNVYANIRFIFHTIILHLRSVN